MSKVKQLLYEYITYLFWQNVSTQYGHLEADNMKFIQINVHHYIKRYSDLNFIHIAASDLLWS